MANMAYASPPVEVTIILQEIEAGRLTAGDIALLERAVRGIKIVRARMVELAELADQMAKRLEAKDG